MRHLFLMFVAGLSLALLPQSAKADHHGAHRGGRHGLCPAMVACPYFKARHGGHWGQHRRWGQRGRRWGQRGRRWGQRGRRWGKRGQRWNKQRKWRKMMRIARKMKIKYLARKKSKTDQQLEP